MISSLCSALGSDDSGPGRTLYCTDLSLPAQRTALTSLVQPPSMFLRCRKASFLYPSIENHESGKDDRARNVFQSPESFVLLDAGIIMLG
jgi:hypothetical protein